MLVRLPCYDCGPVSIVCPVDESTQYELFDERFVYCPLIRSPLEPVMGTPCSR